MGRPAASLGAKLALLTFGLLLGVGVSELLFRQYLQARGGDGVFWSEFRSPAYTLHPHERYGWSVKAHFRVVRKLADASGRVYDVDYSTCAHGFRRCGDPDTTRPRVLVVGDSFTQAEHVSDADAYPQRIAEALDVEVWAFGAGGFGTLQETMVLHDHVERIDPDLVLLQMTGNDLVNNSLELSLRSRRHNAGLRRPYLTPAGEVVYRIARPLPALRELIFRHSKLGYFLVSRWDNWRAARAEQQGEVLHRTLGRALAAGRMDPDLARALDSTRVLLWGFQHRFRAPVVAFVADAEQPFAGLLQQLLDEVGIDQIRGVAARVARGRQTGGETLTYDRIHWSPEGHRLVAAALVEGLAARHGDWLR